MTAMPAAFVGHGSPMNALETNRYTEAWRGFGASRPPAPGDPGHLCALVHQRHRGHRDATPAHHPRLLRLPPGAVRDRLRRARAARARRGGRRRRRPDLGGGRSRQLGHRPRHLVGARARLSAGRHPRRAAVDQRDQVPRLPPGTGREARPAARERRARARQRQHRAQPGRDAAPPRRRRLRLGPAFRRRRPRRAARRPGRGDPAHRPPRLPDRGPDHRALRPDALSRRAGRGRRRGDLRRSCTATPTARCRWRPTSSTRRPDPRPRPTRAAARPCPTSIRGRPTCRTHHSPGAAIADGGGQEHSGSGAMGR